MARKIAYYALTVVLLMGSMAGVALADYDWAAGAPKPDTSVTAKRSAEGEIRGPMETGALPDQMESSDRFKHDVGELPTAEYGGLKYRPSIDTGP